MWQTVGNRREQATGRGFRVCRTALRGCKMKVCPKCGHKDSLIWKPLFWKLYWEYADLEDFKNEYTSGNAPYWLFGTKPRSESIKGGFSYHFEDSQYYYKFAGKTRKMIHRFPKGWEELGNKKLYEKTPSEKGQDDIFQRRLLEVSE